MSSLLDEAIVDAKALKEAALKNAENAVLEKYSSDVKLALDTLLEQDEFGLGLGGAPEEVEGGDASFTDEVPYAFQNEELGAPDEDQLIEIDFDSLKARLEEEEAAGVEASADSLIDATEMATELAEGAGDDESTFLDPGEASEKSGEATGELAVDMTHTGSPGDAAAEEEDAATMKSMGITEDEEIHLSEEMISDLIEELVAEKVTYDGTPRPQGWSAEGSAYNSIEQANDEAMLAALEAHPEELEEDEEEVQPLDVVPDGDLFEAQTSELKESIKELYVLLTESKDQLMRLNLENAKLVYQNKALGSSSLNERQKTKIVEAVQSANSVEEAHMIFETIQNAVGVSNSTNGTRPQTLREAVQRPTSLLINSKKNNTATKDPKMDRMLRLAGLTKQ
tara:strand:+ start:1101 stop:2288 length:1188 start_codon:yes stop_codon:yes gene_type:complete